MASGHFFDLQLNATGVGNGNALPIDQGGGAILVVTGTFVATLTPEISIDGVNWTGVEAQNLAAGTKSLTLTAPGTFIIAAPGTAVIRARISAYTSGSVTVSGRQIPLSIVLPAAGGTGAATEATLAARLSEADFDTKAGSLTEAAPATDTASSGLNGRLQRIAQRITSLIALLPAALVGGRLDVNLGAAPATVTAAGSAADNSANSATKLPAIPARANAADPVWTEGNQVPLSVDLAGFLRGKISSWLGSSAPTVGQKTMASSLPVAVASDQGSVPVNLNQYGGTATTLGAKVSAVSVPVVPATDWVDQDTVGTTVALNALNVAATVALAGRASVGMFLAAGTLIGTIVPEISYDGGTTWVATIFIDPASGGFSTATSVVFAAANAATSLSIQTGGGVTNARVRVSAFTSGTANATLRATLQEDSLIVVQGKPFTALGWYRVSGRTAPYAAFAASTPLVQIRNGTAGVLMIVLRVRVAVMTTVAATTAGGNQRELIFGRSWTVSDTGTVLTLTGNNAKLRTNMATSIADIKHGAPLTAGTRTLDANAMGQLIFWQPQNIVGAAGGNLGAVATGAVGAGIGANPYPLLDAIAGGEQPVVLAQNEGLLIRLGPDAQPAGSTNQTYFDIFWAEASAF